MAASRGDKKAKKAQGKTPKAARQTRAPRQRGKIKKAQEPVRGHAFEMRTRPRVTNLDRASDEIEATGVDSAVARNIADWRMRRHLT